MTRRDPVAPDTRLVVLERDQGLAARFWKKVNRSGECWLWLGTLGHGGRYGSISRDGRMVPAHRVAYELFVGPVPVGLELDHLCRRPTCVNPRHLEPVTHRENMRRGAGWAGENARKSTCERHGNPLIQLSAAARGCRECRREDNETYRRRQGTPPKSESARRTWARRSPEERAEISRRIWETRRRRASVL